MRKIFLENHVAGVLMVAQRSMFGILHPAHDGYGRHRCSGEVQLLVLVEKGARKVECVSSVSSQTENNLFMLFKPTTILCQPEQIASGLP